MPGTWEWVKRCELPCDPVYLVQGRPDYYWAYQILSLSLELGLGTLVSVCATLELVWNRQAEGPIMAATLACEQGEEEKSGLLEKMKNRRRHPRRRSNRRTCNPGKSLEFSCLVTASMRIPVCSKNYFFQASLSAFLLLTPKWLLTNNIWILFRLSILRVKLTLLISLNPETWPRFLVRDGRNNYYP